MSAKVVSVYGYGRFGRLWADILARDFRVKVFSRRGLEQSEVSPGLEIADHREIFACDVLFFCVAISSLKEVLLQSAPWCSSNTLFFDTCSVKVFPAAWMMEYLPEGCEIIASHPMFGPDSYRQADRPLPIVLCNVSAAAQTLARWIDYFTARSMRVELMSAEEHDEMTAYSQGITHYMGRLFAELRLHPTKIDTLGYEKLLEVMGQTCNDSWQLFTDLQNFNPYSKKMRGDLQESIHRLNSLLDNNGS
ncbi:MAG: prephenate dehydrogenase/arogenate dehydrogenase family protein [Desulforhopalus sp.]